MKKLLLSIGLLFFYHFALIGQVASDALIPDAPNPPRLVVDNANVLESEEEEALESKLEEFHKNTSNEIVVLTVSSYKDLEPNDFGVRVIRKWGIGNKNRNNGVLLTISTSERKVYINTGYGLEGALPDITCKRIIDYEIIPSFKKGSIYHGINNGIDAIIKATSGEYEAITEDSSKHVNIGLILFIFLIVLFIIIIKSNGNNGRYVSRGGWGDYNSPSRRFGDNDWFGGGGFGGFGGGSSGGGGFGGFGGGSSGGGGAGGSW